MALALVTAPWGCTPPPPDTITGAPDGAPSASATLALSPNGSTLWVVNPDADSVTAVDTTTRSAAPPVAVGSEPWAVTVTPGGMVVVMNRASGTLSLLMRGTRHDVVVGPEPGGLALSPTGRYAFVTLASDGAVVAVDLELRRVVAGVRVSPTPWAIAVTDDGDADDTNETIVVTHRHALLAGGGDEATNDGKLGVVSALGVAELLAHELSDADRDAPFTWPSAAGLTEMTIAPYGFGFANGLEALTLHDGHAFVAHLLNAPEPPRDFENTVSGALSSLRLPAAGAAAASFGGASYVGRMAPAAAELRLHLNEDSFSTPTNYPSAVALARGGGLALIALGGTDAVMGVDLTGEAPVLIGFWPVASNPRGIVVSRDGTTAYVMNYLSRDVSVLDIGDSQARREIARIEVAPETLDPESLRGKVLFHNASDPRISQLGWISCSSCHPDGGTDRTTWVTPEGHRQTMPLWRLDGTAPFHASATRDEIQDFEVEIEGFMSGWGLAPGPVAPLLGEPNGARSTDLDALAAYVLRGIRTPAAPANDPALVTRGRDVFEASGCAECHGGPAWTRSALPGPVGTLAPNGEEEVLAVLVDVGTYAPGTDALGANGFDVPTLLGLHATAPYLHDGRAATLEELLEWHAPAGLAAAEREALSAFLASIDDTAEPFGE